MTKIKIIEDHFGTFQQPISSKTENVKRYTFFNHNNISIQVISYGATITSIKTPDRNGDIEDIVLGFNDLSGFIAANNPYFGATIGRVCNRIGQAKFALNGTNYELSKNIGENHLHGGRYGFDKFNWTSFIIGNKVVMTHVNEDGLEGYPGTVLASVSFELKSDNQFCIQFLATTTKPTPINLTNHSYFNLAGHKSGYEELYNHWIMINADRYTVTNDQSIPTGQIQSVSNTPFDLRIKKKMGSALLEVIEPGYDDNYCVNTHGKLKLNFIAEVQHPSSGRVLEVYSDQVGVQFYTGNYMPDAENMIYPTGKRHLHSALNSSAPIKGKDGAEYQKHGAFCLETQLYPDAINHPDFPSAIVNPGEIYTHELVYKFGLLNA